MLEAWPDPPSRNRAGEGEGVVGCVVPDSAEDATEGRDGDPRAGVSRPGVPVRSDWGFNVGGARVRGRLTGV